MARFEDDDYEDSRGAGGGQIGRPGDSGGESYLLWGRFGAPPKKSSITEQQKDPLTWFG